MTRVARPVAATLAIVLVLFPVAMERCRTACATAAPQTPASPSSAHACHDSAGGERGSSATPLSRTCGHSDDARVGARVAVAAPKARVAVHMSSAMLPPQVLPVAGESLDLFPPGAASSAARFAVPRNLPLRL